MFVSTLWSANAGACHRHQLSRPAGVELPTLVGQLSVVAATTKQEKTVRSASAQPGSGKRNGVSLENPKTFDRFYPNITGFPFPLGPIFKRKTIRYEVEPGTVWVFEQEQSLALSGVSTTIRMTAIRLETGELFVYSPVAPTRECVELVRELQLPVKYIVLSTYAYEHKIFIPPFNRAFPEAEVWVAPGQWSAPLPLPLPLLGIFAKGTLTNDASALPFGDELECRVLSASVGIQPYTEVAVFHKATRTLLVTDAVVWVPPTPPEVVDQQGLFDAGGDLPLPVLAFSKGDIENPKNSLSPPPPQEDERKLKGWKRNALNVLYIVPANLLFPDDSFNVIKARLIVSPILKLLVFSKVPDATRQWVQEITADWDFQRIIPCHFEAPVAANGQDFRAAFQFLDEADGLPLAAAADARKGWLGRLWSGVTGSKVANVGSTFPEDDIKALKGVEKFLKRVGILNKV